MAGRGRPRFPREFERGFWAQVASGRSVAEAAAAWYTPSDLRTLAGQLGADPADPADPGSREALLLGGPVSAAGPLADVASVVAHVHPGAPPFLLLHGGSDSLVPAQQSLDLAAALRGDQGGGGGAGAPRRRRPHVARLGHRGGARARGHRGPPADAPARLRLSAPPRTLSPGPSSPAPGRPPPPRCARRAPPWTDDAPRRGRRSTARPPPRRPGRARRRRRRRPGRGDGG